MRIHYSIVSVWRSAEGVVDDEEGSISYLESNTDFHNEAEIARVVDEID